jgi:hypothetical protein
VRSVKKYRLVLGDTVFLETDDRWLMLNMLKFLANHAHVHLADMNLFVDEKPTSKTIFMLSKSDLIKDMYAAEDIVDASMSKVNGDDFIGLPEEEQS